MVDLKSICIGDICMANSHPAIIDSGQITVELPTNTLQNFNLPLTLEDAGFTISMIRATFNANGNGARYMSPVINVGQSNQSINFGQGVGAAPSGNTVLSAVRASWFEKSEINAIRLYQNSGQTISVNINWDYRLFKTLILGGVIYRLKCLICYHPLNFGKAVA